MDRPLASEAPRLRTRLSGRARAAMLCAVLGAVLLGVFVAGAFISAQAVAPDFSRKSLPPSWQHPFGTDWLGRDMLLRTIKGLSLSITVGAAASAASAVLATLIGAAAAMGKKWLDSAILWLIDLFMGIPHLLLLILISFACGRGLAGLLIGITATHWTSLARLMRAEVLQLRAAPYVTASCRLGHGPFWVFRHHLLPHLAPQFVVGLVLLFPHAILHESALSFLGYGLPPEQPAIGIILSESMRYLSGGMWWLAVLPGLCLVGLVLLFDKLGGSLQALFSPASAHE